MEEVIIQKSSGNRSLFFLEDIREIVAYFLKEGRGRLKWDLAWGWGDNRKRVCSAWKRDRAKARLKAGAPTPQPRESAGLTLCLRYPHQHFHEADQQ
jgi:hypothetical protein